MSPKAKAYSGIFGIAIISAACTFLARNEEFLAALVATPLVLALIAALYQLLRDEAEDQKQRAAKLNEDRFILGVSSHMGIIAFDKHVEFSEKYLNEVRKTLVTLFREGPAKPALEHANILYTIRMEYALWLTPTIDAGLEPFESALRSIGAKSHYAEMITGSRNAIDADARSKALNETYNLFAKVMGFKEWDGEKLTDELTVEALIHRLRSVLGTDELTRLRAAILKRAIHGLGDG